jgi:hypothetical protein
MATKLHVFTNSLELQAWTDGISIFFSHKSDSRVYAELSGKKWFFLIILKFKQTYKSYKSKI